LLLLSAETVFKERGDLDRAIATELDPKQALAYSNRGFVYMSKGEYDQALAEYNRAVEFDPHFANPYRDRAELKRKMGKLVESLANAEQVRSRTIRAPASWRRDEATAEYHKALAIEPDLQSSLLGPQGLA
jgi:tetratricopeptide (TPR) repeat protein